MILNVKLNKPILSNDEKTYGITLICDDKKIHLAALGDCCSES